MEARVVWAIECPECKKGMAWDGEKDEYHCIVEGCSMKGVRYKIDRIDSSARITIKAVKP